jgi:hypothetical protein
MDFFYQKGTTSHFHYGNQGIVEIILPVIQWNFVYEFDNDKQVADRQRTV